MHTASGLHCTDKRGFQLNLRKRFTSQTNVFLIRVVSAFIILANCFFLRTFMCYLIDLLTHKPNVQHFIQSLRENFPWFFLQFFRLAQAGNFRKKSRKKIMEKNHRTCKFDAKYSATLCIRTHISNRTRIFPPIRYINLQFNTQ